MDAFDLAGFEDAGPVGAGVETGIAGEVFVQGQELVAGDEVGEVPLFEHDEVGAGVAGTVVQRFGVVPAIAEIGGEGFARVLVAGPGFLACSKFGRQQDGFDVPVATGEGGQGDGDGAVGAGLGEAAFAAGGALAGGDYDGGQGRGGGFGALGGRGCRALGEGRTGGWILGISGSPQAAARTPAPAMAARRRARRRVRPGGAVGGRLDSIGFCWVTAMPPPPGGRGLVGSGRFGRGYSGTGLRIRARGRRLSLLMYNGTGAAGGWPRVESVGDLGETEVRLPSQQAVANLMESPPGCLEIFHTSSPA